MGATNAARKLFVLHVFLVCTVPFQITKPGNVESINTVKKFCGTTKIFLHENLKHENFITRKFPDIRYTVYVFAVYTSHASHDLWTDRQHVCITVSRCRLCATTSVTKCEKEKNVCWKSSRKWARFWTPHRTGGYGSFLRQPSHSLLH